MPSGLLDSRVGNRYCRFSCFYPKIGSSVSYLSHDSFEEDANENKWVELLGKRGHIHSRVVETWRHHKYSGHIVISFFALTKPNCRRLMCRSCVTRCALMTFDPKSSLWSITIVNNIVTYILHSWVLCNCNVTHLGMFWIPDKLKRQNYLVTHKWHIKRRHFGFLRAKKKMTMCPLYLWCLHVSTTRDWMCPRFPSTEYLLIVVEMMLKLSNKYLTI